MTTKTFQDLRSILLTVTSSSDSSRCTNRNWVFTLTRRDWHSSKTSSNTREIERLPIKCSIKCSIRHFHEEIHILFKVTEQVCHQWTKLLDMFVISDPQSFFYVFYYHSNLVSSILVVEIHMCTKEGDGWMGKEKITDRNSPGEIRLVVCYTESSFRSSQRFKTRVTSLFSQICLHESLTRLHPPIHLLNFVTHLLSDSWWSLSVYKDT